MIEAIRRSVAGGAINQLRETSFEKRKSLGVPVFWALPFETRFSQLETLVYRAASDAPTNGGGGSDQALFPGGQFGEFCCEGDRAGVGAVVVGLGQGVAFGADLIVELTGQQAAGRGQGVQAETVIGNRLFAGGLEQFRHPTLGGKLGLIAQVLEVHLRRQPVRIGDLEIVVHYLAKQQIQAFPDDSLLWCIRSSAQPRG